MTHWRPYRPEDAPALREIHARQCEAIEDETPFPDFNDPSYLMVDVAERDGEIVGAVVAHATVELLYIGADASLLLGAFRRRQEFHHELRRRGVSEVYIWELKSILPKLEPLLQRLGFRRSNEDYIPFYREV